MGKRASASPAFPTPIVTWLVLEGLTLRARKLEGEGGRRSYDGANTGSPEDQVSALPDCPENTTTAHEEQAYSSVGARISSQSFELSVEM